MIPACKNMVHPFQTDPGTSQRHRLLNELLGNTVQVDARTMADLLDFFVQLSRHINHYNEQMLVSDWQPFFRKSMPFTLAAIIRYNRTGDEQKLTGWRQKFTRKPSASGLNLLFSFVYNQVIKKINQWQLQLTGSALPVETVTEKLVKDKLRKPVKQFILLANTGTRWFCTKNFNFAPLLNNPVWGLQQKDIFDTNENISDYGNTKRKQLTELYKKTGELVQSFHDVIRILGASAEQSLEQSLLPLKEELKEKHEPHLALLFAFLKLFQYLQGDLNSFTKKHLNFFYKEVLQLKPKPAQPDKLHVVFEIQQQLDKYALKKGLILKDGKDNNKAEIYFSTEDEIVVNKAQVADQRTLFLNYKPVKTDVIQKDGTTVCTEQLVTEGVYMAPDATKANGVDKDFENAATASRAALGAKFSKYFDPENKFNYPYPNARLGFIMASPVLLLNEGKRTITITLECELDKDYCKKIAPVAGVANPCCDEHPSSRQPPATGLLRPGFLAASELYNKVASTINRTWYYISRVELAAAIKKGVGKETLEKLEALLTKTHTRRDDNSEICYCEQEEKLFEITLPDSYAYRACPTLYARNQLAHKNGKFYQATDYFGSQINFEAAKWEQISGWTKEKFYAKNELAVYNQFLYRNLFNQAEEEKNNKEKKDTEKEINKTEERVFNSAEWEYVPVNKLKCGNTYAAGDFIQHNNNYYKARQPYTHKAEFNEADWKLVTEKTKGYKELLQLKGFEEIFTTDELELLKEIIPPRKALDVVFSGEDKWLAPVQQPTIVFNPPNMNAPGNFTITITAQLAGDEKPVTFYNAEALGEDLGTTLPAVKIELDDKIKTITDTLGCGATETGNCCDRKPENNKQEVSLYHFFRNVIIRDTSKIDVEVCGVKQLIVQNDESVQDVNAPMFPFGSRPRVGASFYIGSKELFSKNWQEMYINTEWKDKPKNDDFKKHYEHYGYRQTQFEDGTFEIVNSSFLIDTAVLDKGNWRAGIKRRMFKPTASGETRTPPPDKPNPPPGFTVPPKIETPAGFCNPGPQTTSQDVYDYTKIEFSTLSGYERRNNLAAPINAYNVASKYGFLRLTLQGVSFQHDIYPFVLTRYMMAYAGLVSPEIIGEVIQSANEAITIMTGTDGILQRINAINTKLNNLVVPVVGLLPNHVAQARQFAINTRTRIISALTELGTPTPNMTNVNNDLIAARNIINNQLIPEIDNQISPLITSLGTALTTLATDINNIKLDIVKAPEPVFAIGSLGNSGLLVLASQLQTRLNTIISKLVVDNELKFGLPNEPYTPVIKSLSLDYKATADVNDIDLIHLYPYANTYKTEITAQQPTLFPTFCDEGNLFLGIKDLVPGSNVHILFQLAEATADSESEREELQWYYLENNNWKQLRPGFEILNDDTNGLTTSGIIKFLLPANMTNENTVLPAGLHWIKAAIPQKSRSVSEITGIHAQAVKAVFTNEEANDKLRLNTPLPAGSVAKLKEADTSIKKINQPYDAFDGRVPEEENHYYIRVSELLRHKNRAIQKYDYERLVLEAFPQVYKAKCINHSYALDAGKYINDFPVAPGYVTVAVIPDLNQLKAAENPEPKSPVSLLEDIAAYLKKHISPFIRLSVKNPRYEKVNFCLRIKLLPGKDEVYYKEQVKQDIRELLAPWAVGEYDKLSFGQPVNRSEIIRLLESRDYLDYIIDLRMVHADRDIPLSDPGAVSGNDIVPISPRSILVAGNIDVCIDGFNCEQWEKCTDVTTGQEIPCCDNPVMPVMNNQLKQ